MQGETYRNSIQRSQETKNSESTNHLFRSWGTGGWTAPVLERFAAWMQNKDKSYTTSKLLPHAFHVSICEQCKKTPYYISFDWLVNKDPSSKHRFCWHGDAEVTCDPTRLRYSRSQVVWSRGLRNFPKVCREPITGIVANWACTMPATEMKPKSIMGAVPKMTYLKKIQCKFSL